MKRLSRFFAFALAGAMMFSLTACGTSGGGTATPTPATSTESTTATSSEAPATEEAVTIDIFQFKVEIQDALVAAIEKYKSVKPNVTINLETVGGGDDYGAALRAKMQSTQVAIFNIGGPQDTEDWIDSLTDLSNEPWVGEAVDGTLLAVTRDNKVYGLPFNVEGYGWVYNKAIFDECGIDAATLTSYDAIEKAFATIDSKIKDGSLKDKFPQLEAVVELPAKETWVTGLHGLNVALANEFPGGGTEAYTAKTVEFKHKDALKAYYDLQANYTVNASDKGKLNAVDYSTQVGGGIGIERVAVVQQGNWIFGDVKNVDENVANNLGFLPTPLKGVKEDSIPVGVPMYWAVNNKVSPAQVQAAKDFLNWLYQSEEGKKIVVDEFFFIPPFKNYTGLEPKDALGKSVKAYGDAGKTMPWVFMGFPTDWGMNVFGAKLQDYFAGKLSFDEVVTQSQEAWANARK